MMRMIGDDAKKDAHTNTSSPEPPRAILCMRTRSKLQEREELEGERGKESFLRNCSIGVLDVAAVSRLLPAWGAHGTLHFQPEIRAYEITEQNRTCSPAAATVSAHAGWTRKGLDPSVLKIATRHTTTSNRHWGKMRREGGLFWTVCVRLFATYSSREHRTVWM